MKVLGSWPEMTRWVLRSTTSSTESSAGLGKPAGTRLVKAVSATVEGVSSPFHRLINANGTDYLIGAEGQRLRKMGGPGTTYFAPDRSGTLLAEDQNGTWTDYVWLNGRVAAAIVGGGVYPVHSDQTGRPVAVTATGSPTVVWKARGLPFSTQITTNTWQTFNLGFPGQYHDSESGMWQNGARDYNQYYGRYIESDPIGLGGGVNTYTYVGNNPLSYIDPYGLWALSGSLFDLVGGGFELTGKGWHVASISFSGGVGIGGGLSLDPNAAPKNEEIDPCAKSGSNAIGLFAKAGASLDGVGAELSAEGGANVDAKGNFHGYGGGGLSGPTFSKPGGGGELEAAGGIVLTHYF